MYISLEKHNIRPNGVIHIGAGKGELVGYWYKEGVYQVTWIEKNTQFYDKLYQNCSKYGMKQLYYCHNIGFRDNTNLNMFRFKSFWRKYAVDIDIETYDLLYLGCKKHIGGILDGFEDLLNNFKHIVLKQESYSFENERLLQELGYKVAIQDNQHVILKVN